MVIELDEFIADCKLRVQPSQITEGIINRDYKYVHWYNR